MSNAGVFPRRNLGSAEHWGRVVEQRLSSLALLDTRAKQSTAGLGRYSAAYAQDLGNAASDISDLAGRIENAILEFPAPYVVTSATSDWAVGGGWTTVASAKVTVPDDKGDVTLSALADFFVSQDVGAPGQAFEWPFDLAYVTSEFGPRPPLPYHRGIDFSYGGITGDPIPAAADGVVILNRYYDDWGNYVRIGHEDITGIPGTWTGYAHLQSPSPIPQGTPVARGQIIGQVGTTGFSTGAHLHFETALENTRINPREFFAQYGGTSPSAPIAVQCRLVVDGVPSQGFDPGAAGFSSDGTVFKQILRAISGGDFTGKAGGSITVNAQIRTGTDPLERRAENLATLTINGAVE